MRRFLIDSSGGIDAIKPVDAPEPAPGAGEVKIRMRAASLNYRDLGIASGCYLRNDTRPVVPLSDGAGEVVRVGPSVTRWKVGDRVSPNFVRDWIVGAPNDAILKSCLGGGIDGVLANPSSPRRNLSLRFPTGCLLFKPRQCPAPP